MKNFDVVIVGARCAGACLAVLLSQRGLRVCMVDKASFPSDKMSTSLFTASGTAVLDRIGVLEQVMAAGAHPLTMFAGRSNHIVTRHDAHTSEVGLNLGIRRETFDSVLIKYAADLGAHVLSGCAVTQILAENGRVIGVETSTGSIYADLVVGADGQHSLVAKEVEADEYLALPGVRMPSWRFYRGATPDFDIFLGTVADATGISALLDDDTFIIMLNTPMRTAEQFLADRDGSFDRELAKWPELATAVSNAVQVGPTKILRKWHGYFRTAVGPGWALVGDAGHFKDYSPGQGMADAFRHSEALADAIVNGLAAGDIDRELLKWWRWRDTDAAQMYVFATALGDVDVPAVITDSLFRLWQRRDSLLRFISVIGDRTIRPLGIVTPWHLVLLCMYVTQGLISDPRQIIPTIKILGTQARRIIRVAAAHPINPISARRYRTMQPLPPRMAKSAGQVRLS